MTIKKRLFFSNLLMVVIPLLAMIAVSWVSFSILRLYYFPDTNDGRTISRQLYEVQDVIDRFDLFTLASDQEEQNNLMAEMLEKGFVIWAVQDGNPLFTNMNEREQEIILELVSEAAVPSGPQSLWINRGQMDLIYHNAGNGASVVTLVAASRTIFHTVETGPYIILLSAFALLVAIVIIVSLLLAGKIVKNISVPLDNLCIGAQRVREGNLDEEIPSGGVGELEKVCDSFNKMQLYLKINIQKNEKHEQERNEMLAGISHDLRTPLTSIKSYVKGLQDQIADTPEKQQEYLNVIYRKSCDMEGLIDQLFLFSKLRAGNQPFEFQPVFIQRYIVTLLDSIEYDMHRQNAVLTLDSTCSGQRVLLDTRQMTRAITNILENSVKYNKGRNIQITVSLHEQNGQITLRLADDGAGVSDKQLIRLFDSFYRGDEARNNPADGSGLGLSIARNIVLAHKGMIRAENCNGLAVVIDLPLYKGDEG